MEWTSTDSARKRLVVIGLAVGPVLALVAAILGLGGAQPGSRRASFEVMAERSDAILGQDLLETLGFTITLAALIGATRALRGRGGALGTVGAALGYVGIAGFGLSNGAGLAVVALAQLPDRDAAFQTATTITTSGPLAGASGVGWALEILGQLGLLLILAGLWRARLVPPWPFLLAGLAIVAAGAVGTMTGIAFADVLLLVVGVLVATRLARTTEHAWLSTPDTTLRMASQASRSGAVGEGVLRGRE